MRYTDSHKAETHQRLLRVASDALRKKGPDGLSVAEVMKAAGLTHGGFYAHFKSKDAFLSETIGEVFARVGRRWKRVIGDLPPRAALEAYIDHYLSAVHRDNLATGCPVVALNSDLPRQSKSFRRAFDKGVQMMQANLTARLKAAGIADAERHAPAILSMMVGGLALARTLSDDEASEALLASTRAAIKSRFLH